MYDGNITSSPILRSRSKAETSNAAVQECVRRIFLVLSFFSKILLHSSVKNPSPDRCPSEQAFSIDVISPPVRKGLLKGILGAESGRSID